MRFAPKAYRETRVKTTQQVEAALESTANLTNIAPALLRANPSVVQMLRMCTAPPIARDRLIGLAKVSSSLVQSMEGAGHRLPPQMPKSEVDAQLARIGDIILRLADRDIFTWLDDGHRITGEEVHRAATVVADRLCGAVADPIIRNAQEARQLAAMRHWLEARKYKFIGAGEGTKFGAMRPGTFCFRLNVPVDQGNWPFAGFSAQGKPHDGKNRPIPAVFRSFPPQGEFRFVPSRQGLRPKLRNQCKSP